MCYHYILLFLMKGLLYDSIPITLHMTNEHIIYYHMDTTQPVGLTWAYFTHPYYLVAQSQACTTYLFPDTINQTGLHAYHFSSVYWCGLHAFGAPFDHIMAILDCSDAT